MGIHITHKKRVTIMSAKVPRRNLPGNADANKRRSTRHNVSGQKKEPKYEFPKGYVATFITAGSNKGCIGSATKRFGFLTI